LLRPAPKRSTATVLRRIIIWRCVDDRRKARMLAVIFEVQPKPEQYDRYLCVAGSLRPDLAKIDGFVAIERFASRCRRGRVLSLSIWRDEAAIARWREFGAHRAAQKLGRTEIFADYHLRVGEITADSAAGAPDLEAVTAAAGSVTISELPPAGRETAPLASPAAGAPGVVAAEWFESLYDPAKRLLLVSWRDAAAAGSWRPSAGDGWRHRQVRIIRDYGMFERREAPQYYPSVLRSR
jgi:heme-degrading monooxygenase HmoA